MKSRSAKVRRVRERGRERHRKTAFRLFSSRAPERKKARYVCGFVFFSSKRARERGWIEGQMRWWASSEAFIWKEREEVDNNDQVSK